MARAHRLGGRGVQPNRWSHLTVRRKVMVGPHGAGSQARGMGSPAQPVVAVCGPSVGDGSLQWRRLIG